MTGNPLVAGPVDTATPFSGAGLLDDGAQLTEAIKSGDWVSGGLAAFSAAIDTAATVSDPLGSLIAAGLGWLMDHLEPLKGWLNDLTGDAGEVQGFAQTWTNIATQLASAGQELQRVVQDVESQKGEALDAYRRFQEDAGTHIAGAGQWAEGFSTGLSVAAQIVQMVHDMTRDAIAQIVGSAISWAAEAVFSLGLATPWIIEQVSTRVSALASKIGGMVTRLLESVKSLKSLLSKLSELFSKLKSITSKAIPGGKEAPKPELDPVTVRKPEEFSTPKVSDDRPYLDPKTRPSFRNGVVEDVWKRAQEESPDGIVRDPHTDEVIDWTPGEPRRGVWDMGHIEGQKYSDMHQRYVDGELTPQQFRDWYNNPDHYVPETPSANRSHKYE